jgi:S-adenosylmethionine-dependent methyltransferase
MGEVEHVQQGSGFVIERTLARSSKFPIIFDEPQDRGLVHPLWPPILRLAGSLRAQRLEKDVVQDIGLGCVLKTPIPGAPSRGHPHKRLVVANLFEMRSGTYLRWVGSYSLECQMMKITANAGSERFRTGAEKYAAYLQTPEGQLRLDLALANLQEFLPQEKRPLRALDLGCGTGAIAVRLAQMGIHVTLLDSSLPMLEFAKRAAREAGVTDRIELKHGDAAQIPDSLHPGTFDVILCHNLLEYVDDPGALLRGATRALRDSSAIISVLVRNQAGEVLKAAIQEGNLAAAEHNLTAEWGQESLYEGTVRLFTAESLQTMLIAASLAVVAERGVRVLSDYLPARISRSAEYKQIFELERKLGGRPDFAAVARYAQCLAHRAGPVMKDDA